MHCKFCSLPIVQELVNKNCGKAGPNALAAFFDEPAFLWFYIVAVIGTISGNFMGPFFFYFLRQLRPVPSER